MALNRWLPFEAGGARDRDTLLINATNGLVNAHRGLLMGLVVMAVQPSKVRAHAWSADSS